MLTRAGIVGGGIPYVLNYRRDQMSGWRLARDAGNAKVAFIGDSTFAGIGANPAGTDSYTNARAYSLPTQTAALLTSSSLLSESDSFWGDAGNGSIVDMEAYNPSINIGGNWVRTAGVISLGGPTLKNGEPSTDATPLTFTSSAEVDSFDIYYVQANLSLGTFTVNIDGGATLKTVNSNGTPDSIQKTTVGVAAGDSVTVGVHDVRIQRNGTGGNIYIAAIDAYVSGQQPVRVWNMGRRSSTSAQWIAGTSAWSPLNAIAAVNPDLTVISLGINDWLTSVAVATFKTNMQTLITAAVLVSDVVLCFPTPSSSTVASLEIQAEFRTAILELAQSNDVPVVDLAGPIGGSFAAGNAAGLYYDPYHLKSNGYALQASTIRDLLLS